MAKFVNITVALDSWDTYFFEVPQDAPYGELNFTIKVDEDFLREYRKALDVVYRFQQYAASEINNGSK